MKNIVVSALLLSVLSLPAFAADPVLAATPATGQAVPPPVLAPGTTMTAATAGNTMVESATVVTPDMKGMVQTTTTTTMPATPSVPAAITVEPTIIGANATAVQTPITPTVPVAPPVSDHPLCAAAHTPSADVAHGAQVAVNPPRTIPLSVDLAGALNIKGFENIKSEGPIGFVTVDSAGRVKFEGQDLTTNVNNLCASGAPIPAVPAVGAMNAPAAPLAGAPQGNVAPDGSAYNAMPGQGGFRMKPIVDGPSYKVPPRKKAQPKPAPKPEVTEETLAPATSEVTTETTTSTSTDAALPTSSDEGTVPAGEGTSSMDAVPMPAPVPDSATPSEGSTSIMSTGSETDAETGSAVGEVLGTDAAQ